jgi:PAS domain S-box-containing protein
MNKPAHKTLLISAFIAFMLFIGLFTAIAYDSLVKTTEINRNDKATLVVLKTTEDIFVDMSNLETGYRGYLLTTNKMFLEPYKRALADFEKHRIALNNVTVGDKKEQEQLVQLGILSTRHVSLGQEIIARYSSKKNTDFDNTAAMFRGKQLMDSIRNVTALIESKERINLALFDNQKANNAQIVFMLTLSFSIVALLVFIVFGLVVKKNVQQRQKAEEMMVILNRQLEHKVAERTAELQRTTDLMTSILNRISNGFIALDDNSCYTYVNKVAGEILQRNPESLIGKNMWEVFPEDKDGAFYQAYITAIQQKEPVQLEEYYPPAGLWMESHIYPSAQGVSIYFSDITKRKKAEQEIKENERNLKQAEIVAKFGHWKLLVDERIAHCSDGARAIYGADKNVFTNEEVMNFRLPEYSAMLNEEMRALLQDGKPFNVQFKIKRQSDGAIIDVHSIAEYNQQERTVFGILKDITESKNTERARQKAEDSHRESEENLKRAELVAGLGHWKMNVKDKVVYASEGTLNLYGVNNPITSYDEVISFRMPEYDTVMQEAFKALAEEGKPFDVEYKIKRKSDGQVLDIRLLSEYDPKSQTVFGIVQNITERKKAEDELKNTIKELSAYKAALDAAAIVAVTDERGIINHVNDNFCNISKYSRAQLIGADHRIINSGYHSKTFMRNLWATIAKGNVWTGEIRNKAKDGNYYWVYSTIVPFLNEAGKPYQYLSIRWDITERKLAEDAINELNSQLEQRVMDRTAELTQANKALEAFSYSVSHDLRAPVRSVIGFAKIIMKDYGHELTDDVKELFAHIDSSSKRMNAIIDDMLTLAKYEKEKTNLVKVDMTKLFGHVWDNISLSTPHQATLQLIELPKVEVDMSMIEQVVVNLLSNAVKYSSKKEHPVVTVGFNKTDTTVTFYVKDNGAGFDMKNQNRLFGAFQRLHGTSEFEGTGVGLLLVKKIIERHGGQVWAEGEVDKGATFYFSLPCGKGI